jgi:hypothetical protein
LEEVTVGPGRGSGRRGAGAKEWREKSDEKGCQNIFLKGVMVYHQV